MKNTIFTKLTAVSIVFLAMSFAVSAQKTGSPVLKDRLIKVLQTKSISNDSIVSIIEKNGVDFVLAKADETELRKLGANDNVIKAVRENYRGATNASGAKKVNATQTNKTETGNHEQTGGNAVPPPIGKYLCYTGRHSGFVGPLWILAKNQYKIASDGTVGKFVFDVETGEMNWKSGKYVDYNWRGWYAAPGVEDDVRGMNDKQTPAILLLDKEKQGSPFDGERTGDSYFIRCHYAKQQD